MSAILPLSEIQAVNLVLRNMAEAPVNSLTGDIPLEAAQARDTLTETSRALQKRGWFFNTEYVRLSPDNQGEIRLPKNALAVAGYGNFRHRKLTHRNGKLYDIAPFVNSFVFKTPVELKVILGLPFDDLPASAQNFVAYSAARTMQVREISDQVLMQEDNTDETRAWAELQAEQLAAEPLSLKVSTTVQAVLSRIPLGR